MMNAAELVMLTVPCKVSEGGCGAIPDALCLRAKRTRRGVVNIPTEVLHAARHRLATAQGLLPLKED